MTRVQATVVGGEKGTRYKVNGRVVDDIQFIEKIFGGGPLNYIAII